MTSRLTLIAAVARNGVIGNNNALPWHLPEDMKRFKALTAGHAVIMGRKTWESLPPKFRPLPGRQNIVITRDRGYAAQGATVAHSIEQAMAAVDRTQAFVIGGAEIYALALRHADRLELTEIDADFEGDARFPAWKHDVWREISRERHRSETGLVYTFVTCDKRTDAPIAMDAPARQFGNALVIAPQGAIDQSSAEAFAAALEPHLADCIEGAGPLVLDFSAVPYISSVGLRVLMLAARRAEAQKGRLGIAALTPVVKEVFEISRFNLVLKVFDSVEAAAAGLA